MRSFVLLGVLLFSLVIAAAPAGAGAPGSYAGEAPVNSQGDAERSEAMKTALANVVITQSGDAGVLARPDVARAVAQAERYVLQYQYRRNPGGGADGSPKFTLVAQFDSAAVDQMLRKLGVGGGSEDAVAQSETPSQATLWIGGIRNANDYARVISYLAHNNFVRGTQVLAARGDGVLVHLALAADLAKFTEVLSIERTLGVAAGKAEGVDATLVLNP